MGQCNPERIYFVFSSPHKDKLNPAHKTTHLQTAASQLCKPKFIKELFFASAQINIPAAFLICCHFIVFLLYLYF
jgi:hypothetical protein